MCHCRVSRIAATVGCVVAALGHRWVVSLPCWVAALDTMGVRHDEEGFTPPGHVENGV